MKKYPQRKLVRLQNFNYNSVGYYYVTINTFNKVHHFGEISNCKMVLNKCGEIIFKHWLNIPSHYNNLDLDKFIIMPNHLHGIIIIKNSVGNRLACSAEIKRQYQLLPNIIGGFKSGVSKELNEKRYGIHFRWQKSYYDHIIRNEYSLKLIREYIRNNPLRADIEK